MRHTISPQRLTRSSRARLLTAAALASGALVAGCGGGSSSPSVANVASSTTSTSSAAGTGAATTTSRSTRSTTPAKGDGAKLLVEWASCMRRHGDPNQADPTIGVNRVINIAWNPAIPGGYNGTNKGGQGNSGPGQYCRAYLDAAQATLQGGRQPKPPDQASLVKLAACMRANGVPSFPDPGANGSLVLQGGPKTMNNPIFQNAAKVCAAKTGVDLPGRGGPSPGTITLSGP